MNNSPIHLGTLALRTSIKQITLLNVCHAKRIKNIHKTKKQLASIEESIKLDPINTILMQADLYMLTYKLQKEKERLKEIEHETNAYIDELQRKINAYKPMLLLLYPDFKLDSLFDEIEEFAYNHYLMNGHTLIKKLEFVKQLASAENDKTLAGRYNKAIDKGVLNNA